ncbi:MAG: hypothetical protein FJ035_04645 [Chloroflexi bacterium]|nr:hypothetical protein [Chloroflexota bacterium]
MPVSLDLALEVDLAGPGTAQQKTAELLYLTREALKRGLIDDLWRTKSATSPRALAALLRSEAVVDAIRRELRRTSGHRVESADPLRLLSDVIHPDVSQT